MIQPLSFKAFDSAVLTVCSETSDDTVQTETQTEMTGKRHCTNINMKKKHKSKIVTITKKNASETVVKYLNLKNLKKGK